MRILSKIFGVRPQFPAFSEEMKSLDVKTIVIIITACIGIILTQYMGIRPGYRMAVYILDTMHLTALASAFKAWITSSDAARIHHYFYWLCVVVAFYIALPMVTIKLVLRGRLVEYGLGFMGCIRHWRIYAVMMLVMIPVIALASSTAAFQRTYPFYHLAPGESLYPLFWIWESFYLLQFVGVEFFFRGFLVHGLKQRFGIYSVVIMVIPYCMIHFGKPMTEAFGAILAGLILGCLSYWTRTIWMGVALHFSIALCMDVAALWRTGRF